MALRKSSLNHRALRAATAAAAVAILVVSGAGRSALGESPPHTTHDKNLYLLVDDHWIAEQQGLKRIINRAKPLDEPIIWPDDPKTEADCAWGNVIREPDGRFRLWYCTMMMGHTGGGPHEIAKAGVWGRGEDFTFRPRSAADGRDVESMLGRYAESKDGIRWTKPDLGLVEFRGSKRNNIVLNGEGASRQTAGALTNFDGYTILRDDAEPDANKRYKMIAHWESVHCWDNHELSGSLGRPQAVIDRYWDARGEYITYSPDGLRWEQPLERLTTLPSGGGDRLLVVRDHRRGRWMAYVREGGWSYPAFSHSADLVKWSAANPARQITPEDVQAPAVECMIPFNYGNQDLGFPCGMDKPKGILTVMLASRHDGGEWTWIDNREPFIPYGPKGSYCATGAVPLHNEPFVVGDELLIFFNAFSRNQNPPCPGKHQWVDDGSEPGFEIGKTAQFMVVRSRDDGVTWSQPENLTRKLKQESWWLLAPSPQSGIQLPDGTLVMPVQGRTGRERLETFATLMVSRDQGATWTVGKPGYTGGNECQAAMLGDGSIMLNIRNDHERYRAVVVTKDLGETWESHATSRNTLIEPNCNGSLLRVDYTHAGENKHLLLFANPHTQKGRTHHTIQVSFDDGQSWPKSHHRLLDEGLGAGYPSLTRIDDDHVGIVYEGSQAHLVFQKFTVAELLQPPSSPK